MLPAEPLAPLAPTISERLTWAEICQRYPDQHVYLGNVERERANEPAIQTAQVLGAGSTNREALDQAMPWRDHHATFVHRFTGRYNLELRRPPLVLADDFRDLFTDLVRT